MLNLKFIKVSPDISKIWVKFRRSVEPFPRLGDFPLAPKQLGDREKDVGVVFTPF